MEVWGTVGDVVEGVTTNVGGAEIPVSKRSFLEEQLIIHTFVGGGFIEPAHPESIPRERVGRISGIDVIPRSGQLVNDTLGSIRPLKRELITPTGLQ